MEATTAPPVGWSVIEQSVPPRVRDRAALLVAVLAMLGGLAAFMDGRQDSGVWLEVDESGRLVVQRVQPWSRAAGQVDRSDVVLRVDGIPTFPLPGTSEPAVTGEALYAIAGAEWWTIEVVDPDTANAIAAGANVYESGGFYAGSSLWRAGNSFLLGLAILALAAWYLRSGRAGPTLQAMALPIAAATAAPLLVVPLEFLIPVGYPIATAITVAAVLVLAEALSTLVADPATRRLLRLGSVFLAAFTVLVGFLMMGEPPPPSGLATLRWAGLVLIPLLPAIAAARPLTPAALADGTSPSGRLVESTELLFVGLTPGVAAFTMTFQTGEDPFLVPILLWIGALLVGARFTVRPLVRLATRANLQRDLVVAAMEAERARLAADLHDEALQDLTLLVRRLDAAGDAEGAAQARAVADRLREICGDLRLPILDDLGVGPALDWLVLRIERLAGGEVRLERAEGERPPADVELAFFRVAQEALANAVKHGRPPIVVRYRASPTGASLSVDDAGTGIAPEAREEAPTGGHFGLLNMQQRAEQIGAILDVRRWPAGGTHVALEWRAR
jgi:signal transduction histidine kinase